MARTFVTVGTDFLENTAAVLTTTPITLSIWVKPSVVNVTQLVMMLSQLDSPDNYFGVVCHSDGRVYAQTKDGGGGSFAITASAAMSAGVWHLITAVFASSTSRSIYLDGANKVTDTGSASPSGINRTLFSGRYTVTSLVKDFGFVGSMAEAGIWNIALSDAEVASLFVSNGVGIRPSSVQPGALQAYWKILGSSSPEPDEIANAHPLTVNGTSSATHLTMQDLAAFKSAFARNTNQLIYPMR